MNAKEIREKSDKDLLEQLVALRREQFNLRVQQATGQQARPDQFSRVRRDISAIENGFAGTRVPRATGLRRLHDR